MSAADEGGILRNMAFVDQALVVLHAGLGRSSRGTLKTLDESYDMMEMTLRRLARMVAARQARIRLAGAGRTWKSRVTAAADPGGVAEMDELRPRIALRRRPGRPSRHARTRLRSGSAERRGRARAGRRFAEDVDSRQP